MRVSLDHPVSVSLEEKGLFWFLLGKSVFKGKPRWLRRSWKMRQSLSEKLVTPTDLKSSPGFFFFPFLQTCRKGKKVGKRGRQRESGRDASFIEWDCICCSFSPSINICGWLVLASELSAVREGLVLIRRDSNGKGQRGGAAGDAAWRVWALCPTWSSTVGRIENRVWGRDKGR